MTGLGFWVVRDFRKSLTGKEHRKVFQENTGKRNPDGAGGFSELRRVLRGERAKWLWSAGRQHWRAGQKAPQLTDQGLCVRKLPKAKKGPQERIRQDRALISHRTGILLARLENTVTREVLSKVLRGSDLSHKE